MSAPRFKVGDKLVVTSHAGYDIEKKAFPSANFSNLVPVGSLVTVREIYHPNNKERIIRVQEYGRGIWERDLEYPTKLARALK